MTVKKLEEKISTYYNYLLDNNAEFKQFVEANEDKSIEDTIAVYKLTNYEGIQ